MTDNITKKKSKKKINKKDMWELFDQEINNNPVECIYTEDKNMDKCELCNHETKITDLGFQTCMNPKCGVIFTDSLGLTAEWRYYGTDSNTNSDPTRCGMPINPLLKESSFGCKVLSNGKLSYEMRKIRRYTEWQAMPYHEKQQYNEFCRITAMAQNGGISKLIIDEALRQHKKLSEHRTYRGLNRDSIIAASVYIACSIHNHPRTAKEIAKIFNLNNTNATKGCKNAKAIIEEIERDQNINDKTEYCNANSIDFMDRFCSKLNINIELTNLCKFIATQIDKHQYIPENTPNSIAGGVIYFVIQECNLSINKTEIKTITGVSEVTINKCYKKLEKIRDKLIPSVILQKYI
tara:strand:+ start:1855 stop:2904 length:1050 start_codon:yes stop_codon:yes gene_type:complete